jgi:CHASE3 domain sensor protein
MNLSSRSALTTGFVLVVLAILANAELSAWNVHTLAATDRWVVHTLEVLTELEDTQSLLKDAETGQRGFLLTGRDHYLDPYRAATDRIPAKLQRLRELTADNSRQRDRLPVLDALVGAKLAELDLAISLRRQQRAEDALDVVRAGDGKRQMDAIRRLMTAMEAEERQSLEERTAAAEAQVRHTNERIALVCGLVLACQLGRRAFSARRRKPPSRESSEARPRPLSRTLSLPN